VRPGAFRETSVNFYCASSQLPSRYPKKVSKASIAKILDVAPSTLHSFIQSRRLGHLRRGRA
jgi:hypothetical protein